MHLRTMAKSDIPAGVRLNQTAGWNQTPADWQRFLKLSPEGCFVAELEGQVRGTVTTISFESRFAWVGMVLVDPQYRGRGVGTKLLQCAIQHLDERKIATIKLDATPQGKPLYEKLGFVPEYEVERWALRRAPTEAAKGPDPGPDESEPLLLLESILERDREAFGADRGVLLRSLHLDAPDFTMATWNNGVLEGYTLGRRGLFADHLGPWMAKDAHSARYLLEAFLARSSRETLVVDCLKSNNVAVRLLQSFGFNYTRLLTRMYRGPNNYPGRPNILCAILGPEFG
jgi:ribosomal protein S18 acetylase RimI-like enzyme